MEYDLSAIDIPILRKPNILTMAQTRSGNLDDPLPPVELMEAKAMKASLICKLFILDGHLLCWDIQAHHKVIIQPENVSTYLPSS